MVKALAERERADRFLTEEHVFGQVGDDLASARFVSLFLLLALKLHSVRPEKDTQKALDKIALIIKKRK